MFNDADTERSAHGLLARIARIGHPAAPSAPAVATPAPPPRPVHLSEVGEKTAAATENLAETIAAYIERCADAQLETAHRKHRASYERATAMREQARREADHQREYGRRLYQAGVDEQAARDRFYGPLPALPVEPDGLEDPEFREVDVGENGSASASDVEQPEGGVPEQTRHG